MSYSASKIGQEGSVEDPRFVIWHTDRRFGFNGGAPDVLEDEWYAIPIGDVLTGFLEAEYHPPEEMDVSPLRVFVFDRMHERYFCFQYNSVSEEWEEITPPDDPPDFPEYETVHYQPNNS